MDRNTTIGFVLIGVILMVWLYLNSTPPEQQKDNKPKTEQQAAKTDEQKQEKQEIGRAHV